VVRNRPASSFARLSWGFIRNLFHFFYTLIGRLGIAELRE
jgi:hypothetical protein